MRALPSILVPLAFAAGASTATTLPWNASPATAARQDVVQQDQDEQDETLDPNSPFYNARRAELLRLQKEIQGAWMMVRYETPTEYVNPSDFRGFALIDDGFMTLLFQNKDVEVGLFGASDVFAIQAMAYRYKLEPRGSIQLASIMGFDNDTPDGDLVFDQADAASEFDVRLLGDSLSLARLGGSTFEFRRVTKTPFPPRASDALRAGEDYFDNEK